MSMGEDGLLHRMKPAANDPATNDRRARVGAFHEDYQDARTQEHLSQVLEEYRHRYEMGQQRLQKQLTGSELDAALVELKNEYERLKEIAPEVAWHRRRVERDTRRDDISGLDGKASFAEMFEFAIRTLEEGERVVLITFDLDKFKDINETIGHVTADKVLGRIGEAIKSAIRSDDCAARIGGDEFTIILNRVKEDADVLQLIQRIGQHISAVTWTTNTGMPQGISFSAGYSAVEYGQTPFFADVREAADHRAGYSKRLGRNRLTVVEGEQYTAYELQTQHDGTKKYVVAEQGNVDVLETPTEESCFKEVISNGQRIAEEIERFFSSHAELVSFLREKFRKTEPGDIYDLNDRQKAKMLLYVRSKGESEPVYWVDR